MWDQLCAPPRAVRWWCRWDGKDPWIWECCQWRGTLLGDVSGINQAGLWLLQKYSGVKCIGFPSLLLKLFSCLLCLLSCLWELFPLALILPFPGHSAAAEGSCWREQPCAWLCLLPCSGNHGSLQFSSLARRKSQPSHGKTG